MFGNRHQHLLIINEDSRLTIIYVARLNKWTRDKILSFVPPDGKFDLMEYRYVPTASTIVSARQISVPFSLSPHITINENGGKLHDTEFSLRLVNHRLSWSAGTFDLTVSSRLSSRVTERLALRLFLGEGATSCNCTVSSGATWNFDPKTLVSSVLNLVFRATKHSLQYMTWEILKAPQGSSHTLRGSFTSS